MREFIKKMRSEGLVVDVTGPCSPDMEAAKMASRYRQTPVFFADWGCTGGDEPHGKPALACPCAGD